MHAALVGICLALGVVSSVRAQGPGGPPPEGGGPGGPGMGGGGMGGPQFPGGPPPQQGQPEGPPRIGLQLGPPGQRWWDDKVFIRNLRLRPEQQARMDAIFEQNRAALLAHIAAVHQAEAQMEQLANSPAPDEAALFVQIDRVSQSRAELEKATTHMLLQLRKEMDADQIKRLERFR